VNTGVARVTGKVKLDPSDLDNSVFDLSIYPADDECGHALCPEGALPSGYVPDATDKTLVTFKSTRILSTGSGKLEVVGDLKLTRVERAVTATPNEAYAGPVYGGPVIHSETHEITFRFPNLSASRLSGPLTPAMSQKNRAPGIVGSAQVGREEFPELVSAIKGTNWPPGVQNNDCHMPASVGEDYSGPLCTPAAGDQTTIVLDLTLLSTGSEGSVGNGVWIEPHQQVLPRHECNSSDPMSPMPNCD